MNARARVIVLVVLLICGAALAVTLYWTRTSAPLESTLTTPFQILGTPIKLVDRLASRVLPVGELDEAALGDVYRVSFDAQVDAADRDQQYLDALIADLLPFTGKSFAYRAYVDESPTPNAMALPGGVVLVTRGLFSTLGTEAELVAVLAHELGHIERGHCFDTVRFELLAQKIGADGLGALADFAAQLLLRHSYSKTMEHEADLYAFELLTHSRYDPRGEGAAFRSLVAYLTRGGEIAPAHADVLRDYFSSHPPLEVRADEFGQRADAWWRRHSMDRRYVGRMNLENRTALRQQDVPGEWTGG